MLVGHSRSRRRRSRISSECDSTLRAVSKKGCCNGWWSTLSPRWTRFEAPRAEQLRRGSSRHRTQNRHDLCGLGRFEQAIDSERTEVRVRRRVEQRWIHRAVLGEVVDDHVYELDLIRGQRLPAQKAGERILRSAAIEADQRTDEKAEAM